jgi:glutamate dehydrogenase/leucine dehydrogenase
LAVRVQKLESTDGFLLFDLDGAERSAGVARLAPKVLNDSAELLARSVTYTFAAFGLRMSGASAGINAKPDGRDAAIAAFVEEVKPLVASGALTLHASTGLSDSDLAALGTDPPDPALTAQSAIAAAEAALGTLDGATVAIVGGGPIADTARVTASDKGATVADDSGIDATADALLIAGKTGVIDHEGAESVKARVVVPLTPLPVTAKAYAAFRRADIVYVPDFIALAAPLLATFDASNDADPVERVRELMQQLAEEGPNGWLVAIGLAEAFLSTWQDGLPFGRPLA